MMVPIFLVQQDTHIFSFHVGESVHHGLRHTLGLYALFFYGEDGHTVYNVALAQARLGDQIVITLNEKSYEAWIEVKQSTCPFWDIINKASLAEVEQFN